MKNYTKTITVLLFVSLILPNVAFAAWWNPLSWSVWSYLFTRPATSSITLSTSTISTSTRIVSTENKNTSASSVQQTSQKQSQEETQAASQVQIDAAVQAALNKKAAEDAAAQATQEQLQQAAAQQQAAQQTAQDEAVQQAQQQALVVKQAKLNAINQQVADLNAKYESIMQSYKDQISQLENEAAIEEGNNNTNGSLAPMAQGRNAVINQQEASSVNSLIANEQTVTQEYNLEYNDLKAQYGAILNAN